MVQEAGVPDPVKIVGPAVEDHMARVSALVAVILVVQGLVHVADEVNHELQCLRLDHHAIAVRALPRHVDL